MFSPKVNVPTGGEVGSVGYTTTRVEGEQPCYRRNEQLEVLTMKAVATPLKGISGPAPAMLRVTRNICQALVVGQRGAELTSMACVPGTVLVLDGCGASQVSGFAITCWVRATALQLPKCMNKLLSLQQSPKHVYIVKGRRAPIEINFTAEARMVRLLSRPGDLAGVWGCHRELNWLP